MQNYLHYPSFNDPGRPAFLAQYERVFEAAQCRTQIELAGFLGIRQSSVSDARRRQSIPAEWLLKLLAQRKINPEWIMTGKGSRTLQAAEGSEPPQALRPISVRPPEECSAQELVDELVRRALRDLE